MPKDKSAKDARRAPNRDQDLLVEDIAYLMQVKAKQVREWLREGRLRGKKIGKLWHIKWAAYDDFYASW